MSEGARHPEVGVARRANGEGSIFRRKDGTWSAELSYRDQYGALKRRTVYGRTQADVRAKFREARERIECGAPVKDASMTVAAWLEEWIATSLAASGRKQATKDLYATLTRTHLVPTVGAIPLGRLRPSDVEALIVTKRDAGLAGSTIRTIYTVLRSALDIASRDGLIRSNPAAAVKRPGVERKEAPHLTAEQAQALLEAMKGDRLESLFRVMLATGLRRGEALGLHWADVDLDAGLLRVRWTLSRTSQGLQLDEPKTDKSRRTVPLPRSGIETLRAHQTRQLVEQRTAAGAGRSAGWSSPPRSVHRSSPATCFGASRSSRNGPDSAASPCTPSGTPRRASCWRPAPTPRSCKNTWVTPRTPSPRTSTATSVRRSNARRRTGSTKRSAGDCCCPIGRVAVRVAVVMQKAGRPIRATRL
jgi:integrase